MTQKQKLKKIIREELSKYQEFFKSALEKFGVESANELSDEKKKEFFNYIDKNYEAKSESRSSRSRKKIIKEEYGDFDTSNYRWSFHPGYVNEFEDVLEDQDPMLLNFPHTVYFTESTDGRGDFAHAALSTDGNSSFISVTDFDNRDVIYKVFKDWKLAVQYFKKLIKTGKIKAIIKGKTITI